MREQKRIRVLLAKPGLDGHDRGVKVVALALRDAGCEVIYTGLHRTSEQIVEAAVQEDADVVGLSILSGAHLAYSQQVLEGLRAAGSSAPVVVGGNIPLSDHAALRAQGVAAVIATGSPLEEVVRAVRDAASQRLPALAEA
jgi:methylmalonyl-CoA mutase C-terminal domain/subunit